MAIITHISAAQLTALVGAYDLGALRSARGIDAGTVNTSYALELDAGPFFLRVYEEQDAQGAAREARVLTHLAACGVATPAPVAGRDGAPTRAVAGKPAALFPWVSGDMLCQRGVTPEAGERVGEALARVHVAGHAPDAPLDAGRFTPAELEARCERVAGSRDDEARLRAPALRGALAAAASQRARDLPSGLVHGDLFRDNVLWRPRGGEGGPVIAALLDFESAHDGPFAYDLAVTILSWAYGARLEAEIARAIVRGYRAVREVEEPERAGLYDEAVFACLRFTVTRITDDAARVGKRWQRFVERQEAIEALGRRGFRDLLGL